MGTTVVTVTNSVAAVSTPAAVAEVAPASFPSMAGLGIVNGVVNVKSDFGATGNGTTDDTTAIQAAADACALTAADATPILLYFPPCAGGYKTTAGITVGPHISVIMDGPILYTGSTTAVVALSIGTTNVANFRRRFQIRVIRQTQSPWTDFTDIGVRFICAYSCPQVDILEARNFTIGAQLLADTAGCAYNQGTLGDVFNNAWGLDLTTLNGGFCNENQFWGGHWSVATGVNTTVERVGVHIGALDAGTNASAYVGNNNNRFWGPTFELNATNSPTVDSVAVWVEYGLLNYIRLGRCENTSIALRAGAIVTGAVANGATGNVVEYGYVGTTAASGGLTVYGFTQVQQYSTAGDNIVRTGNYDIETGPARVVAHVPDVVAVASTYDPASPTYAFRGLSIARSGTTTPSREFGGFTLNPTNVTIGSSRGLGWTVETQAAKRFVLDHGVDSASTAGRVLVRCFDSGGSPLDNTGPNAPYVRGSALFTYNSGAAGWLTGSDSAFPTFFQVGADVATMWVGVYRGSADIPLHSLLLVTLDPLAPRSYPGYTTEPVVPALLAINPPSAGAHLRGEVLWNATPSASGTMGWVCTSAGTPGTWKTWGAISS